MKTIKYFVIINQVTNRFITMSLTETKNIEKAWKQFDMSTEEAKVWMRSVANERHIDLELVQVTERHDVTYEFIYQE